MKKALTVLFAGALFATVAFADNDANARFRMKTGRDLPVVEKARTHALAAEAERVGYVAAPVRVAPAAQDAETRRWMKTGRHTTLEALNPEPQGFSNASPAHNDAEERFRMKTGRSGPANN